MATELNLQVDGTQIAAEDYRNSTYSGSTRAGPSGSGQFCAMRLSTAADRTITMTTVTGAPIYGILQNKPSSGIAASVAYGGISKAVAASTAIGAGMDLMVTSTSQGAMIPWVAGAGVAKSGRSIEAAGTLGQIFSMFVYGAGAPGGGIVGSTS